MTAIESKEATPVKERQKDVKDQIIGYTEKYNNIAVKAMQFFSEDMEGNMVFSPFSVIMLLSIVADAVDGDTRREILDVLKPDLSYEDFRCMISAMQDLLDGTATEETDKNKHKIAGNVVSSNAVCIQKSIRDSITPGYEERLARYRGRLFASTDIVRDVNAWVKENTGGMISEIADESMRQMMACLMNAIAFEADWLTQYEEDGISTSEFTNSDGTESEVCMLYSTEQFYIENENFTGFLKPYKGMEYSYMALLPKKKGKAFMKRAMENLDFSRIYKEAWDHEVFVTMPEFKYDFERNLTGLFRKMGIETLFTPQADFTPMSSETMKMDSILHKAYIEVDRKGTKAAAVTMGMVIGSAPMIKDIKTVVLDRPFVYAVMHNETGLPVFTGIMNHAVEAELS